MSKTKTPKAATQKPAKTPKAKAPSTIEAKTPSTVEATIVPFASAKADSPIEPRKLGALDAAAKVLAEAKEPMNCKDLIEAMAKKGYWTSPGGKTPHATLYAAMTKEIVSKRNESRFKKVARGQFALA